MLQWSGRTGGDSTYSPTGYQMIRTVEIENFRGFERLRVEKAGRLNVLVGPNGSGKTSFLEALFLAGGNSPELILRTRQFRGRDPTITAEPESTGEVFLRDVFRDPSRASASIRVEGDGGETRSVTISRKDSSIVVQPDNGEYETSIGAEFIWETPNGKFNSTPKFKGGQFEMDLVPKGFGVHLIPARVNMSEAETARAYSTLSVEGQQGVFEEALLREFSAITSVNLEAPAGRPALYATMAGSNRKLPLTMISGGISHLAGMMLRIAANPKSVLLVDEIENGFFHAQYGSIWRALHELAVNTDGQLFATTHSLECLVALSQALPESAADVRFFRTRLANGEIEMEQMAGDTLFRALKIGEVR